VRDNEDAGYGRIARQRFGRQVKTARRAKGWVQEDLAEAADVSARTVSNVERGVRVDWDATIVPIASALGWSAQKARKMLDDAQAVGEIDLPKRVTRGVAADLAALRARVEELERRVEKGE
jgi:transcriptional regulator with XRE-family HTH domain